MLFRSEVEWVVEDRRQTIRSLPDDPLLAKGGPNASAVAAGQWFLRTPSGETPSAIDPQRAWVSKKGNANVVVAVIDTGVTTSHPYLTGKLKPG